MWSRSSRPRFRPMTIVLIAAVVYTALFSFFCIQRWRTGYLGDPDYGLFNQSFWTTLHDGRVFYNTYEEGSHFRTHNSPIFFLVLPLYALYPKMQTLLVVQTVAVALGSVAVFRLGTWFLDEDCGVLLALAYLLYHPLHGVNYDQFNELCFLPAPLLFAFYNLYRRRMGAFWVCALLALSCKEDVSFVTALLGLYTTGLGLYSGRRKGRFDTLVAHGLGLFLVSVLWFAFSLFVLFPYLRHGEAWPYFQERYGNLGSTMGQVVWTMITRPWVLLPCFFGRQAILLFFELMLPLALLPLRVPRVMLLAAPTWVVLLLSSFGAMHNTGSRYMAPVISCLLAATAPGIRDYVCATSLETERGAPSAVWPAIRNLWCTLFRVRSASSAAPQQMRLMPWSECEPLRPLTDQERAHARLISRGVLVLTLLFALAIDTTPFRFPFKNIPRLTAHERARDRLVAMIGPHSSVSTQPEFYGKLANRRLAWIGYHPGSKYILVDPTRPLWYDHAQWNVILPWLLRSGKYRVICNDDGALLLRRTRVFGPRTSSGPAGRRRRAGEKSGSDASSDEEEAHTIGRGGKN